MLVISKNLPERFQVVYSYWFPELSFNVCDTDYFKLHWFLFLRPHTDCYFFHPTIPIRCHSPVLANNDTEKKSSHETFFPWTRRLFNPLGNAPNNWKLQHPRDNPMGTRSSVPRGRKFETCLGGVGNLNQRETRVLILNTKDFKGSFCEQLAQEKIFT